MKCEFYFLLRYKSTPIGIVYKEHGRRQIMNIHSLHIEGFRKHKDTTILFSDSTFLIGENNVGKSSILAALDYLLNIKSKIPEEEFYSVADENGNIIKRADEVVLTAEFRNLPHESNEWRGFRGRIIHYAPTFDGDTGLSFIYRKTFSQNSTKIEMCQYIRTLKPEFNGCNTLNDYFEKGLAPDDIPAKLKEYPWDKALKKTEKELIAQVESLYDYCADKTEWFENPGGIQQNVASKLPIFLLIPAQDREEEISGTSGVLQKTLAELFREVREESENYRQAQHYLDLLQNELDPSDPKTEISRMLFDLNEVVSDVFPSASILARANLSDPDSTIKPTFSIQMRSNIPTKSYLQGTGMIRSAVFSLLRYKSIRDAKKEKDGSRSLIIGFEEPEIYLHPNAISKIKDTIYRLAENNENQIVCTTHSPFMIDLSRKPRQILNCLAIGYDYADDIRGEKISVKAFNVTEAFKKLQDENKDYVKMLLRVDDAIAKSFFVKHVLIVEGDTEQIVLNETMPLLPHELESTILSDWHIVRARGKAAIIPLIKYFNAMGIDAYIMHDGDYGTDGAEKFNEPIRMALDNDAKLVVLNKCIEDVLGYVMQQNDKPLHAYNFIHENWHSWDDISQEWKSCVERIFNAGNHIIVKTGAVD